MNQKLLYCIYKRIFITGILSESTNNATDKIIEDSSQNKKGLGGNNLHSPHEKTFPSEGYVALEKKEMSSQSLPLPLNSTILSKVSETNNRSNELMYSQTNNMNGETNILSSIHEDRGIDNSSDSLSLFLKPNIEKKLFTFGTYFCDTRSERKKTNHTGYCSNSKSFELLPRNRRSNLITNNKTCNVEFPTTVRNSVFSILRPTAQIENSSNAQCRESTSNTHCDLPVTQRQEDLVVSGVNNLSIGNLQVRGSEAFRGNDNSDAELSLTFGDISIGEEVFQGLESYSDRAASIFGKTRKCRTNGALHKDVFPSLKNPNFSYPLNTNTFPSTSFVNQAAFGSTTFRSNWNSGRAALFSIGSSNTLSQMNRRRKAKARR